MGIEEKYQKPATDYYASIIKRKIINSFLAYPEFMFFGKIIIGLFAVAILFFLFKKYFGLL
jgi:hypothetical protein